MLSGANRHGGSGAEILDLPAAGHLAGLGNSVFHPADLSILSHCVRRSRVRPRLCVDGVAGSLGFVASPVLIGAVARRRIGALPRRGRLRRPRRGAALWANPLAGLRLAYASETPSADGHAAAAISRSSARRSCSWPSPISQIPFAGTGLQTFSITALIAGYGLAATTAPLALTAYLIGSASASPSAASLPTGCGSIIASP